VQFCDYLSTDAILFTVLN